MFYVYILVSQINKTKIYIGSTNNLIKRFKEHNDGKVFSTKTHKPWFLIYYEAYNQEKLARIREQRLKNHGNALQELKKKIGLIKDK